MLMAVGSDKRDVGSFYGWPEIPGMPSTQSSIEFPRNKSRVLKKSSAEPLVSDEAELIINRVQTAHNQTNRMPIKYRPVLFISRRICVIVSS